VDAQQLFYGWRMLSYALLLAQDDSDWGHMDWDGGWWILMVLGMVLFWGLVVLGAVWLVREMSAGRRGSHRGEVPDPVATLDHRLASGEISIKEYRDRRAALTGK